MWVCLHVLFIRLTLMLMIWDRDIAPNLTILLNNLDNDDSQIQVESSRLMCS